MRRVVPPRLRRRSMRRVVPPRLRERVYAQSTLSRLRERVYAQSTTPSYYPGYVHHPIHPPPLHTLGTPLHPQHAGVLRCIVWRQCDEALGSEGR